jgi:two-component system, chemotaxis family, protein-glutamate methylesterase/glutaminase
VVAPKFAAKTSSGDGPYRVMIVDDSAVIRGIVARWLGDDPDIEVVTTAGNGEIALKGIKRHKIEVVVLDIEMPVMDGLTALPLMIKEVPGIKVIMSSTLTRRNADVTMRALAQGAVDYMAKPESASRGDASDMFHRELIDKVKTHGATLRSQSPGARPSKVAADNSKRPGPASKPAVSLYGNKPVKLRAKSLVAPRILGVGSSTGGPQALLEFFGTLKNSIKVPIVITQHMPPTFTTILAEHISGVMGADCHEGIDGEEVLPGKVYLAPGDNHMVLKSVGTKTFISLNQGPQVNFCRPSVDPLFDSMAEIYGAASLLVILTGMGHDGRDGSRKVVDAGGTLIAQDEPTSVVWGMPGAVATAGICHQVLPLKKIAPTVLSFFGGARR